MAEVAPAPAAAAPAKAPEKKAAKAQESGTQRCELTVEGCVSLQGEERRVPGCAQEVRWAGGYDVEKNNSRGLLSAARDTPALPGSDTALTMSSPTLGPAFLGLAAAFFWAPWAGAAAAC
ncbi:hypothetical protein DPEC_G00069430 [Dallia pectoralis]|uniref:Uncharacterized protein n=1 Tax=Dallia pectoralis TaxID=75939 RepID=A0ACC2H1N7_DALPE|nr:hypothetical protein DPEC_G00069430 [Dallia pectoralis]